MKTIDIAQLATVSGGAARPNKQKNKHVGGGTADWVPRSQVKALLGACADGAYGEGNFVAKSGDPLSPAGDKAAARAGCNAGIDAAGLGI